MSTTTPASNLPCTYATRAYHEDMDRPTFEALKRLMELVRPHLGEAKGRTDDWLEVSAWMQENDKDITDLETLGTSDPRRKLREVR